MASQTEGEGTENTHSMTEEGVPQQGAVSHPTKRANFLQTYVMGDIQVLNDWLEDKPGIVQSPNWFLRSLGAPIFLNNPLSGLIILVALFINSPWVATSGLIGLVTSIITAVLLKVPKAALVDGGATFHGLLTGIVLATSVDKPAWYPWLIFPVIATAALSVYLAAGLGAIFGRFDLPAFNLPFNVAAFSFLAAASYTPTNPHFPIKPPGVTLRNETFANSAIHWGKVFEPILLADAQIYGSTSLVVGALVLAAQLLFSPTIMVHAVLSAIISAFTALSLAVPPKEIYDGTWSYNAMLTCTSLGGVFFVLSIQSHILALFSAIFATLAYGAFKAVLRPTGLPVIAFPFVFTAAIFLAVTTESKNLQRVPLGAISYPEAHRRRYKSNSISTDPT